MRPAFATILSCALLICGWFASPAAAQTRIRDDAAAAPEIGRRFAEREAMDPSEESISGRVLRTKQVDARPSGEKMLVVLLDKGEGERQIVDLGPAISFKHTPIYSGDHLYIRGPRVTLGEADVLLATDVRIAGGESVVIPRARAAGAGYVVSEPMLKLEGRIENLRPVRLRDSRVEHLVAEVVDRTGDAMVVDLGPSAAIWRADLKRGEWITVYGQRMRINDRPVLLAREISKGTALHRIDRDLVRGDAPVATTTERASAPVR
jgi:hypothetical protein